MDNRSKLTVGVFALTVLCLLVLSLLASEVTRLGAVNARLERVAGMDARLDILETKLDALIEREIPSPEEAAAVPVGPGVTREDVDRSVGNIARKLDEAVVLGINDLKDRIVTRGDVNRLAAEIEKVSRKVEESSDPALKAVRDDLNALKRSVEAFKKVLEDSVKKLPVAAASADEVNAIDTRLSTLERRMPKIGGWPKDAASEEDFKALSARVDRDVDKLEHTTRSLQSELSRDIKSATNDISRIKREVDDLSKQLRELEYKSRN